MYLPETGFHLSIACLLALLITATLVTPLFAEVYKWIDEKGETHYSDKPVDHKAETVRIKNAPKPDPAQHSRAEKHQRLLKVLAEERQEMKQRKGEAAAEKRQREINCARARKDLQNIKNARFLYKKSADPNNPVIYSDEERAKITDTADKAVQHWCH